MPNDAEIYDDRPDSELNQARELIRKELMRLQSWVESCQAMILEKYGRGSPRTTTGLANMLNMLTMLEMTGKLLDNPPDLDATILAWARRLTPAG